VGIVLLILLVALVLGVLGVIVKGLLWLLFIAVVLFRPEGIAGAVTAAFQKHSLNAIRRQGSSAMRLLFGGERWR